MHVIAIPDIKWLQKKFEERTVYAALFFAFMDSKNIWKLLILQNTNYFVQLEFNAP